jgi:hypothetical protein
MACGSGDQKRDCERSHSGSSTVEEAAFGAHGTLKTLRGELVLSLRSFVGFLVGFHESTAYVNTRIKLYERWESTRSGVRLRMNDVCTVYSNFVSIRKL